MKELYVSVVGSHAWNMEREGSDWDYQVIYQAPTESILLGNMHDKGHQSRGTFDDGVAWDRSSFEIGHHIRQLMKGNINHVIGLFGPGVDASGDRKYIHRNGIGTFRHTQARLQRIFIDNLSKNIYNSINGMTTHNLRKYFDEGRDSYLPWRAETLRVTRAKKLGQIERMVRFGFRVLTEGEIDLHPVDVGNGGLADENRVRWWQGQLERAYHFSDLPEKPDRAPYDEFLLELRKEDLGCQ